MSDPLGDMLTRIRNGQMANKSAIKAPASKLRANVLEVLRREGYIRGFETVDLGGGKTELSIELKYHNGEPVIRELRRVSKPGRRIYTGVNDLPQRLQRPGHRDRLDAARRPVRRRGARGARRRRSPLHGVLIMSRIGKHPVAVPGGVTVAIEGQTVSAKGKLGALAVTLPPEVEITLEDGKVTVAPRDAEKRARAMWGMSRSLVQNLVEGVSEGYTPQARDLRRRLSRGGRRQDPQPAARLQPRHQVRDPRRHQGRLRHADRDHDQRCRQAAGRPDRGRDPPVPPARALQGQGREICRGAYPPQGRQEEVGHGEGC